VKSTAKQSAPTQHLNYADVVQLVGAIDSKFVSAILATGASCAEIEQALNWLEVGTEAPRFNTYGLTPAAELVCDILLTAGAFSDGQTTGGLRR
jgi:hypothetical protein